MKIGYCTIASTHYLPQVQILESSLRRFHPEPEFHILLCDSPDICREVSTITGRDILSPERIDCAPWRHLAFCFDGADFSAMLKPFLLETLFRRGYDALIYLDPDIEVFSGLDRLAAILRDNNAVLTPHVCLPAPNDGKRPAMEDYVQAGHYDPGFIGVSASREVRGLLSYWRDVTVERLSAAGNGALFADRYVTAAIPSLLEKTVILRDPAYNMAYWNVFQRKLEYEEGRWTTDSGELKFFHFSGLCHQDPTRVSLHQNRVSASAGTPLFSLLSGYCAKIPAQPWAVFRNHPYSFSFYSNGEPITLDERNAFLEMSAHERAEIGNPFDANHLPRNPIRIRCKEMLDRNKDRSDWIERFKQKKLCAIRDSAKLATAIRKHKQAHRPIIGWFLRKMTNYYPNSARRLMEELLECDNKTFISKTFTSLLGRAPDTVGMEHYGKLLHRGVARTRIIDSILNSSEYRSRMKARR